MNGSIGINRLLWLAGCLAVVGLEQSVADEFKLKDGRMLVGKVVSAPKADNQQWAVQLSTGTFVRFADSQLEINGHIKTDKKVVAYEQSLVNVEPNAKSQSEFAGWCVKNLLKEQGEAHYRRALDFDADFALARSALAYRKDKAGRWAPRDEVMTQGKGKVKFGTKYVYPEVLAVEQAKAEFEEKAGHWRKQISRLNREATTGKSDKAITELKQINDPYSIPAFSELLLNKKTSLDLRIAYAQILAQIESPNAVGSLVQASVVDDDARVRNVCLDAVTRRGGDYAVVAYLGHMRRNAKLATQKDEAAINRAVIELNNAAVGLNALRAESAVLPLIGMLITNYTVTVEKGGNYSTSGANSFGTSKVNEPRVSKNEAVLSALVNLTGKNFAYDEKLWLNWYASVHAAPVGDLRRDL